MCVVGCGGGRQCGRGHTTICFYEKNLRMEDMKLDTHTHRERETHTHTKRCLLLSRMQPIQNNNQPLQKVTKSLYIVTHLGQLPFIIFTQMARTWAIKEDSVNTTIIHWYSTLPRNGRIHSYLKKVLGQVGFVRVGRIRRQKTELVGLEELKPIVSEPISVARNHHALCPASTGPICRYAHLLSKRLKPVCRKTLGHSICDIVGCGYLL